MSKRLYVLTRKDLSKSQQAVQAGHAVAEYLLKYPSTKWDNGTLIYLGVQDENELIDWYKNIPSKRKVYFKEPDRNNEMTAIAIVDSGYNFRELSLL